MGALKAPMQWYYGPIYASHGQILLPKHCANIVFLRVSAKATLWMGRFAETEACQNGNVTPVLYSLTVMDMGIHDYCVSNCIVNAYNIIILYLIRRFKQL